jgi:hypothetical protein
MKRTIILSAIVIYAGLSALGQVTSADDKDQDEVVNAAKTFANALAEDGDAEFTVLPLNISLFSFSNNLATRVPKRIDTKTHQPS